MFYISIYYDNAAEDHCYYDYFNAQTSCAL